MGKLKITAIMLASLLLGGLLGAGTGEVIRQAHAQQGASPQVLVALRNNGSGWDVIKDETHAPIGVDWGATKHTDQVIRVPFNFHASKVNTFVVTVDEAYAKTELMCGASVGLTEAEIQCFRRGQLVNPNDLTLTNGNLWVMGSFSR